MLLQVVTVQGQPRGREQRRVQAPAAEHHVDAGGPSVTRVVRDRHHNIHELSGIELLLSLSSYQCSEPSKLLIAFYVVQGCYKEW